MCEKTACLCGPIWTAGVRLRWDNWQMLGKLDELVRIDCEWLALDGAGR